MCAGSDKNMSTLSLDGVDVMGERLAEEVSCRLVFQLVVDSL